MVIFFIYSRLQKCLKGTCYAYFQLILTVCEGGTSPQFTDAVLARFTLRTLSVQASFLLIGCRSHTQFETNCIKL